MDSQLIPSPRVWHLCGRSGRDPFRESPVVFMGSFWNIFPAFFIAQTIFCTVIFEKAPLQPWYLAGFAAEN